MSRPLEASPTQPPLRTPNDLRRKTRCELCRREQPLTFHHLIPRKNHRMNYFRRNFGKDELTRRGLMLCRLCHRHLHRLYDEQELGRRLNTREAILGEPEMQKFLEWAKKQR